ncbi:MAG: 50S ribosomal protein L28 [Candidatus Omnitrophica bacterium]|nr:50S ribosomal protein L28 [Candidatus Omnitrophota bacterium]MDD5236589.1 50S ribosomal protein L28 [Candidatus Omnitrophota bacterium]MDD5611000.1 50S ribosomal protein L28 [Candidatus Omnitrophota bacterium]
MLKKCFACGKGPVPGKNVVRKGLAKIKGGTGQKIVRATRRIFLPNLHKTRLIIDGRPTSVYICTKCLKTGRYIKA